MESAVERTRRINVFLRSAYMESVGISTLADKPLIGYSADSIGPWPEIIFRGHACPRSIGGFCAPCGYSNVPLPPSESTAVQRSILRQMRYVLQNFDSVVIANQNWKKEHSSRRADKTIKMALAPIGSFFSDYEISFETRDSILRDVLSCACEHEVDLKVFLEAYPLDVIASHERGTLEPLADTLRKLRAVVVLGFESLDPVVRNLLYCKGLSREEFESAIRILKSVLGIDVGAFVFAGVHSLSQMETVNDASRTLSYLRSIRVMPVVMVSNLKDHTLNDLLYTYDRYKLPDPRTIVSVVEQLEVLGVEDEDPWLFADPVGGPPEPRVHAFSDPRRSTCARCGDTILGAIRMLRKDREWESYFKKISPVSECRCANAYSYMLRMEKDEIERKPLLERALANISIADSKKEEYVERRRFVP